MPQDNPDWTSSASIRTPYHWLASNTGASTLSVTPDSAAVQLVLVGTGLEQQVVEANGEPSGVPLAAKQIGAQQWAVQLPGQKADTSVQITFTGGPPPAGSVDVYEVTANAVALTKGFEGIAYYPSSSTTSLDLLTGPDIGAWVISAPEDNPGEWPNPIATDIDSGAVLPVRRIGKGLWSVPVRSGRELNIAWSAALSGQWEVLGYSADPWAGMSSTSWTVDLPEPAAGADWSYTLPAPARLVRVTGQFTASSATASRWPNLVFSPAPSYGQYLPMVSVAVTASQSSHLQGWPGAPTLLHSSDPVGHDLFTFPDRVLPAGTAILSSTFNLQSGDQWTSIELDFA